MGGGVCTLGKGDTGRGLQGGGVGTRTVQLGTGARGSCELAGVCTGPSHAYERVGAH